MKMQQQKEYVQAQSITLQDILKEQEGESNGNQQKWKEELKKIFTDVNLYKGNLLPSDLFVVNQKCSIQRDLFELNQESQKTGVFYPIVDNLEEAKKFIKIKGCFFNIYLVDQNAEQLISQFEKNPVNQDILENVCEIHIYNLSTSSCYPKFCELRNRCHKVKGLHNSLKAQIDQIKKSLKYRARFKKVNDVIQYNPSVFKSFWPAFLTADDLSFNASYRANILANVRMVRQNEGEFYKVSCKDIEESKNAFSDFVYNLKKSLSPQDIRQNKWQTFQKLITDYNSIKRDCQGYLKGEDKIENKIKILAYYKAKSSYYNVLNTMLKICKTPSQFKNIALPAAQTHVVIKNFYDQLVKSNKDGSLVRSQYQLYRGTRSGNMEHFKPGQIYETLGYLSFSTSKDVAKDSFLQGQDPDGCLVILDIPPKVIHSQNELKHDNGFVDFRRIFDIDKFKTIFEQTMKTLDSPTFEDQKQVLINQGALLKFIKLDLIGEIPTYHFQYMTIEELEEEQQEQKKLLKNKEQTDQLKRLEKMVLSYRYYKLQYNEIEDKGDLLRQAQQFDAEKDYYVERSNEDKSAKIKLKLIDSQLRCGKDKLADIQIAIKAFIQQNIDTIYQNKPIRQKVKAILKELDNLTEYENFLQKEINQLRKDKDNKYFDLASALNQEAQIYLLEERLFHCKAVLKQSLKILAKRREKLEKQQQKLRVNESGEIEPRNCCVNFAVNLGVVKPQVPLSQEKRKEKEKQIHEQILRNIQLTLKVQQNLINCYGRMDEEFRKRDHQTVSFLYKSCLNHLTSYIQSIGGQEKLSNQFKLLKVKLDILLQNGSKSIEASPELKKLLQEEEQKNPNSQKVGNLSYILASSQKQSLSSALKNPASIDYTTTTINQTKIRISMQSAKQVLKTKSQRYLDDEQIEKANAVITAGIQKSIHISLIHKGPDHPSTLSKRLALSEHLHQNNQIEESNNQIFQVIKSQIAESHISGAKGYFLLGKNYICKGELGKAEFQFKRAEKLLTDIKRVKNDSENQTSVWDYISQKLSNPLKELYSCPLFYDIKLQIITISRLTNMQDPEQIYEDLVNLKQNVEKYLDKSLKNRFLSKIFEQLAYIVSFFTQGSIQKGLFFERFSNQNFIDYFEESINYIRERGQSDIDMANIYCSIAKQLTSCDQNDICDHQKIKLAEYYLDQAVKIFGLYSVNHPSNWVPVLTIYRLNCQKKKIKLKQATKKGSSLKPNADAELTHTTIKMDPENTEQNLKELEILEEKISNSIKLCLDLVTKRYKHKDHINFLKVFTFYGEHLSKKSNPSENQIVHQIFDYLIKIVDKDPVIRKISYPLVQQQTNNRQLVEKLERLSALDEKVQIKLKINRMRSILNQLKNKPKQNQNTVKESKIEMKLSQEIRTSFQTTKQNQLGTQRTNQSNINLRKTVGIKLNPIKQQQKHNPLLFEQQNTSIASFQP